MNTSSFKKKIMEDYWVNKFLSVFPEKYIANEIKITRYKSFAFSVESKGISDIFTIGNNNSVAESIIHLTLFGWF